VFTPQKPLAHRAVSAVLSLVLIAAMFPNFTVVASTGRAFGTPVGSFERVASYDVPGQVAEIIASTPDGETLIYTDSASQEIGFITLTDPRHPTSAGSVAGTMPASAGGIPPALSKTLVRDLLAEDDYRLEKIEGAALTKLGALLVVNDNDGVGETRLLRLRGVLSGRPPR
jgi:hypothetical protein